MTPKEQPDDAPKAAFPAFDLNSLRDRVVPQFPMPPAERPRRPDEELEAALRRDRTETCERCGGPAQSVLFGSVGRSQQGLQCPRCGWKRIE